MMMIQLRTRANRLVGSHGLNNSLNVGSHRHPVAADLFPETTILFADIAGFTAWSSGTLSAFVCVKV